MQTHILGFPRIGANRELKKTVESYWKGKISSSQLNTTAQELRKNHWQIQKDAGLSFITTGDFSFYDHILDTTLMLGIIPERFQQTDKTDIDLYFKMARGDTANNLPAMEMTKWFNTNYHYIVPEVSAQTKPALCSEKVISETKEALSAGFNAKPVLVGPITFLSLCKSVDDSNVWDKLDEIVTIYLEVISQLSELCTWIQIDEPILCTELQQEAKDAFVKTYQKLNGESQKLILTTYFDSIAENTDLAVNSGCAALHVDLVRGKEQSDSILSKIPDDMILSAGIVDGRNIWKNNFQNSLDLLKPLQNKLGNERLWISSSSSLLHTPVNLQNETKLDNQIKDWLAFAVQKCSEITILAKAIKNEDVKEELEANKKSQQSRKESSLVNNAQVQTSCNNIVPEMLQRNNPYQKRKESQAWLKLPEFPTTTIGSFPQTDQIRKNRRLFKQNKISQNEYSSFLRKEISSVIHKQEDLGLDVLVHGEPERNDMVEYFGEQLSGFCFTQNGWVQSYGSRCVKPPVIFGDISRPKPMTVDWITYAQSNTDKPLKGMLTGPVTILCWSFVRDDLPRREVCKQIALAIREEVKDLESAGIKIIQIDEAALSEGMPVKEKDRAEYLKWAVECFRLATTVAEDSTQIHTHMCYSEFNRIIRSIAEMDADVISIESSRSRMELLDSFRDFEYPNEIGPGIWDIHSPRVPTTEEIVELLKKACNYIPKERLWVNPDCGLKTRKWEETSASIKNMVKAAHIMRKEN